MATYLANPDYQSYQFTPYVPPYQETLQAIQAKSQYWLEGASKIKTAFDNVVSKEYTRDDSKAKINQFRQEVEPKLEQIAKKDLGIGDNQKQAFDIINPIRKDAGLLVDEFTTNLKNEVMKSAQADAAKNGGKYYNQYSVQYANQIAERYKNATSAEDKQYAEVLQSNPYMPYDPKAADNVHNRVKTLMSQTITEDEPMAGGRLRRVTKPRYSITQALAILEETASPQEKSLIQLMGKTQFNAMQLAAGNDPQQLQKVGQLYKSQIDAEYNDKIAWATNKKLTLDSQYNSLDDNDPRKKTFQPQYEKEKALYEKQIEDLTIQKDNIKAEDFSDPAMWRMGEQYAASLYNTQHYRNLAVSLGQGEIGSKIVKDDAYWEAARLNQKTLDQQAKALKEQQEKEEEAARDMQLPIVANLTINEYNDVNDAAKDIKSRLFTLGDEENKRFVKTLLTSLDITPIDDSNIRQDLSTIMEKVSGDTRMSTILSGISEDGKKNLEQLLKATGTSNLPENVEDMTVKDVQTALTTYLKPENKENFLALARKAGMNNGNIDMIASLYNQRNEIDNVVNKEKESYSKVYKNVLKNYIPQNIIDGLQPNELFRFETKDVLEKVYKDQLDGIAKKYNLNQAQQELVLDYLVTGNSDKIISIPSLRNQVIIGDDFSTREFAGLNRNIKERYSNSVVGEVGQLRNQISNIKENIDKSLVNQLNNSNGQLGFSVIQKSFDVVDSYNSNATANWNIRKSELSNFISQGTAVNPDGSVSESNQEKLDFINNNLGRGVLDYARQVVFRNAPGSNPWMEIRFKGSDVVKAIKDGALVNNKSWFNFGDADYEKALDKPVRIFFNNSSEVESRIQGISNEVQDFTTAAQKRYDFVSGNKMEVGNYGSGGNMDIHFSGSMMRYEPYTNGMIKIGQINVNKRDGYENVSRFLTPNSTKSFNQLRMRLPDSPEISRLTQALTTHDARATILKDEIEANPEVFKNYIKQENGEILLDLQGLQRGNPDMYNKLVNIMSNGRY
jgi:hypothetical protein